MLIISLLSVVHCLVSGPRCFPRMWHSIPGNRVCLLNIWYTYLNRIRLTNCSFLANASDTSWQLRTRSNYVANFSFLFVTPHRNFDTPSRDFPRINSASPKKSLIDGRGAWCIDKPVRIHESWQPVGCAYPLLRYLDVEYRMLIPILFR